MAINRTLKASLAWHQNNPKDLKNSVLTYDRAALVKGGPLSRTVEFGSLTEADFGGYAQKTIALTSSAARADGSYLVQPAAGFMWVPTGDGNNDELTALVLKPNGGNAPLLIAQLPPGIKMGTALHALRITDLQIVVAPAPVIVVATFYLNYI